MANPLIQYWYFHLPNYIMAALMWSMFGRIMLSIFVPPQSTNYIWRAFCALTDPVVRLVALITPRAVPQPILVVFSFVWLLVARFFMLAGLHSFGLAPPVTA